MKCYFAVEKPVDVIRNVVAFRYLVVFEFLVAFKYLVAFQYVMVVLLACSSTQVFSQYWHSSSDTLKVPVSPTGYHTTMGYIDRYDKVPCYYTIQGSDKLRKGYKSVFVHTGYYTDTDNTVGVFFNRRKRRVYNVNCYYFR